MIKKILILAVLAAASLSAQDMVTDRPDQTESAVSVPKGSFQIEAGGLFQRSDIQDTPVKTTIFPGFLLRYGLFNGFELRVNSAYIKSEQELFNDDIKYEGFSDIEVGGKFVLTDGAVNTALLAHLVLPSGNTMHSNEEYGYIARIALSHPITDVISMGYNIGYLNYGSNDGDLIYSASAGFGLTDKLGCFLEYYGVYANLENDLHNMDAGFTYLVEENFQIDFSFGASLDIPSNFYSAGISWRIDSD